MAIQLSVTQSGGNLRVYAHNTGNNVVIIDSIGISIGTTWVIAKYQDDFYFGDGRVDTGWYGLMVKMPYSSGPAQVHATAHYWEVDKTVKSPTVNVS